MNTTPLDLSLHRIRDLNSGRGGRVKNSFQYQYLFILKKLYINIYIYRVRIF